MPSRENLDKYIQETYGVTAEFPWLQYPGFAVYRHNNNQKWFAVVMNLSRSKFGLPDDKTVDAVNLKCDPMLNFSVVDHIGIFPGWHMNKEHWISVLLDGTVAPEDIYPLIKMSFVLTDKRSKKKKSC